MFDKEVNLNFMQQAEKSQYDKHIEAIGKQLHYCRSCLTKQCSMCPAHRRMEDSLKQIYEEFGEKALDDALEAVKKHTEYYESERGTQISYLHNILDSFKDEVISSSSHTTTNPVTGTLLCGNCKKELKKTDEICPNCGTKNSEYKENINDAPKSKKTRKRKIKKRYIVLAVFFSIMPIFDGGNLWQELYYTIWEKPREEAERERSERRIIRSCQQSQNLADSLVSRLNHYSSYQYTGYAVAQFIENIKPQDASHDEKSSEKTIGGITTEIFSSRSDFLHYLRYSQNWLENPKYRYAGDVEALTNKESFLLWKAIREFRNHYEEGDVFIVAIQQGASSILFLENVTIQKDGSARFNGQYYTMDF
ncbi:MAG: hypothetical protein IJR50_07535 [Treponema sp.]|nr:hypothetical protein [Treponema sp.]